VFWKKQLIIKYRPIRDKSLVSSIASLANKRARRLLLAVQSSDEIWAAGSFAVRLWSTNFISLENVVALQNTHWMTFSLSLSRTVLQQAFLKIESIVAL
jgi:hypothetical protein